MQAAIYSILRGHTHALNARAPHRIYAPLTIVLSEALEFAMLTVACMSANKRGRGNQQSC